MDLTDKDYKAEIINRFKCLKENMALMNNRIRYLSKIKFLEVESIKTEIFTIQA